jgi:murein DD-endopeptidase MepM/ murein hydrolase activator NlpD
LTIRAARAIRDTVRGRAAETSESITTRVAAGLRSFSAPDRLLPVSVATIVAVASLLAVLPSTSQGAVGGTEGSGAAPRLAINGGVDGLIDTSGGTTPDAAAAVRGYEGVIDRDEASFRPFAIPRSVDTKAEVEQSTIDPAPVLDDGTLLTGYAPTTEVEDGADLIETYKVKSGDTLVDIAHRNDVSMMTLWWANHLKSKDDLSIGQVLRIPPVNGLVYTVKDTDTLDSLASRYKVSAQHITKLNGLEDPVLVVGQVLVLPGAKGAPIPTPKPTPKPDNKSSGGGGGGGGSSHPSGPVHYNGGQFHWPVIGGGNYISQYFHYGHEAIDIAADYGSHVVAAAGGRVIFAGWKSNGGGYQVWISHGGNLYTTYNHMSGITVGDGQSVGRGQQVGRVGQSGYATGPHLHFEVWIGPVWSGGTRVNPLRYF